MAATVLDSKGWKVNGVYRGRWTLFADTASAATEGITTEPGTINTQSGNDNLVGRLTTGTGSQGTPIAGVFISAGTTLNLGFGDDRITGYGPTANSFEYGIRNEGVVNTGYGNDRLEGTGNDGIFNGETGQVSTGDGNDRMTGIGISYGLVNRGVISMDAGRDSIIGSNSGLGIFNQGVILMGDGADTVDALIGNTPGGFSGTGGIIDLGRGNDVLKGFGDGSFKGGEGTDNLILQDGVYTFTAGVDGFAITATGSGATMNINSFETFGGVSSGVFTNVSDGTFTILGGVVVP